MSVGVEAIDNDHKNLLKTINEINDAIAEERAVETIGEIFERLERYVVEHFEREERMMEQAGFVELEEHIRQHQRFVDKVPYFREKLLTASSMDVSMEVSLFLSNWLMNHILMEDLSYAQALYEHGLSDLPQMEETGPLLGYMGRKLALKHRIFLSALIPIAGLLVMISLFLSSYYQDYSRMQQLLGVVNLVRDINQLSHELQLERGLSTGYISSGYKHFHDQLLQQRRKTDHSVLRYQQTVAALPQWLLTVEMQQLLQSGGQWLAELQRERLLVDEHQVTVEAMFSHYTSSIRNLLSIYDTFPALTLDPQLSNHVAAALSLVNMKEANGQERAHGVVVLEDSMERKTAYRIFSRLIGEYQAHLHLFTISANVQQMERWHTFTESEIYREAMVSEGEIIAKLADQSVIKLHSEVWFSRMTARIDGIGQLVDAQIVDIEQSADHRLREVKQLFYITSLLWLLLLLLNVVLTWMLIQSIIRPIRRLTDAMELFSQGVRDIRFTDIFANDELGKLYRAYEQSRRNLIKANIAMVVRYQKQAFRKEVSEREKVQFEQLASIDAMTGAINRRKFEQLAEHELQRADRYQRPLCCLMLDIDHFKQINDQYGHAAGDEVLRAFFHCCAETVRDSDTVARIGGEEFVVLLPETVLSDGVELAERIRHAVEQLQIMVDAETIVRLTVSIGVSHWSGSSMGLGELMEQADSALYDAKRGGRNRVASRE